MRILGTRHLVIVLRLLIIFLARLPSTHDDNNSCTVMCGSLIAIVKWLNWCVGGRSAFMSICPHWYTACRLMSLTRHIHHDYKGTEFILFANGSRMRSIIIHTCRYYLVFSSEHQTTKHIFLQHIWNSSWATRNQFNNDQSIAEKRLFCQWH